MQDAVNGASVNWAPATNQQPRAGPTPGSVQTGSSENPQVAQRALAWTGHLEWQDTVSTVLLSLIKKCMLPFQ